MNPDHADELEEYGDPGIVSLDRPVPKWLRIVYVIVPIWGLTCLYLYWNGTTGWLDRGYWHELQIAANTTFPVQNQNDLSVPETPAGNRELQHYP